MIMSFYFAVIRLTLLFRVRGKSFGLSDFSDVHHFIYIRYFVHVCMREICIAVIRNIERIASWNVTFSQISCRSEEQDQEQEQNG
jgi:hypothetical protein